MRKYEDRQKKNSQVEASTVPSAWKGTEMISESLQMPEVPRQAGDGECRICLHVLLCPLVPRALLLLLHLVHVMNCSALQELTHAHPGRGDSPGDISKHPSCTAKLLLSSYLELKAVT